MAGSQQLMQGGMQEALDAAVAPDLPRIKPLLDIATRVGYP
jgi:hypothetical protein